MKINTTSMTLKTKAESMTQNIRATSITTNIKTMGKAKNTKGASILMMIFELLVVVAVVAITMSVASAYAKSETVQKITAAEDLRMMIDTLVSVPGDAQVHYPMEKNPVISPLVFILRQDSITVFVQGESEVLWTRRQFSLPMGFSAQGTAQQVDTICLEKKNKVIVLRKCP